MAFYSIKGSTLKIIAVISMLIDHIGACILQQIMTYNGLIATAASGIEAILTLEGTDKTLALLWWVMRLVIGRIAFPIFCFLLVEGFMHTRSAGKYALRLLVFALVSEVPFDLAISHQALNMLHQNVFLTLLISLLMLWGLAYADKKAGNIIINTAVKLVLSGGAMAVAEVLNTDYGASGVALVLLLYVFRYNRSLQNIIGAVTSIVLLGEPAAALAFAFVAGYNGARGLKLKYLFYLIYPMHLILFYGVCIMLGLAG